MTSQSKIERTIKCVVVSAGSVKGYPYSRVRVVECRVDQRGYRNERGVKVLRESGRLYRPLTKSGRGIGPETIAEYRRDAATRLAKVLGV